MISQASWPSKAITSLLLFALAGCITPTARFHRHAINHGFERGLEGALVTYQNALPRNGEPLHVYLDGDGAPTLRRGRVTQDPTSRERLILDLMAADEASSVLVGRPCYYGDDVACEPSLWTQARYSKRVIDKIATAINAIAARFPSSRLVIIGYSGGGTIAMLAAPAIARVDTVITIAANLDTDAWAAHHGYAPLSESLNPASAVALAPRIKQLHLFGTQDTNVPAKLVEHVVAKQPQASLELVPGFGHRCCWAEIWPDVLRRIAAME